MINLFKIKHSDKLLKLLINGQYINVNELESELSLSRRSVFYLIKKTNLALEKLNIDTIQNFSKVGYFLTPSAKKRLLEIFKHLSTNNTFDKIQRSNLICWLLINNSQISTISLAKKLNVSKNTILNDINLTKRLISKKGLQINQTYKGKIISGSELTKRLWVLEQLSNPISAIYSQLNIKANEALEITYQIHYLEEQTKNYFTDDAISILSYFLVWLIKRIQYKQNRLPNSSNLHLEKSSSLNWSNHLLRKYNIKNYSEAYFISNVINTSQFFKINFENSIVKNILPISYKIIEQFNLISGSQINSYKFAHALTTHLVSTFYRAKFKVLFHNKNLKKIVSSYNELFAFTKYAIIPFEKFINTTLSNDEVSLIALYFGSELQNQAQKSNRNSDVLIVCSSGIGTSFALRQQLVQRYPMINFSKPLSLFQFKNSPLTSVKLIISTTYLNKIKKPVLTVSGLPSQAEWIKIDKALQKYNILKKQNTFSIETLIDIISEYARIENFNDLKRALNAYFEQIHSRKNIFNNEISLLDILSPEKIIFETKKIDWKTAIYRTMTPLENAKSIDHKYTLKIISLTRLKGPYMVLGNGVMLAHSNPNDGVNKLGISLLMTNCSIDVYQKKVWLIIGLAPIDKISHLNFLSELIKLIQNQEFINRLKKANSTEEIYHTILEFIKS